MGFVVTLFQGHEQLREPRELVRNPTTMWLNPSAYAVFGLYGLVALFIDILFNIFHDYFIPYVTQPQCDLNPSAYVLYGLNIFSLVALSVV